MQEAVHSQRAEEDRESDNLVEAVRILSAVKVEG